MATFTTKAFCPTLSLSPSHCLSVSLSHISTQLHTCAVSVSFASTNSLSRTPSPSLSVSGCVSLSAKPIFYSVSLALSHLSFCSDSSVFIYYTSISQSPSLRLFPCFPLSLLYLSSFILMCLQHTPFFFLSSFFLLFCPQLPLSSPPPSLFLCLSLTPSPHWRTARSLESAAKQRLFEKNAKRFPASCVVHNRSP